MSLLTDYVDSGTVYPHIEVAHVAPLSSTAYQTLVVNTLNQIILNQKLIDTDNLGTFTASTSTLSIPAGRWAYRFKTSIYQGGNAAGGSVGLSSLELNDLIGLEQPAGIANYTIHYNTQGEFISQVPYTLSLIAVTPASMQPNCIIGPVNNLWPPDGSYTTVFRQTYKRTSLKLWKLK